MITEDPGWIRRRLFGVEVTVGWGVFVPIPCLLGYLFLAQVPDAYVKALLAYAAYLLLILIHELGHALVVRLVGGTVTRIDLRLAHGVCWHSASTSEKQTIAIAWGGVLAQAVLFVAVLIVTALWRLPEVFGPALLVLIALNVVMFFHNLLPISPLDGSKAWRVLRLLDVPRFGSNALKGIGAKVRARSSSKAVADAEIEKLKARWRK